MIRFIFGGGLGNQMFKYAYLYSKLNSGTYPQLPVQFIMKNNKYEDKRDYSLDVYDLSLNIQIINSKELGYKYKLYRIIRSALLFVLDITCIDKHKFVKALSKLGYIYNSEIYDYWDDLELKNSATIEGAFQNWRYFDEFRDEIKKEFTLTAPIPKECESLAKKMNNSNSVCVHIRRGDYLKPHYATSLAICDETYYKKAINLAEKKIPNPEFYIFTNSHEDHKWIKEHYEFNGKIHYVDMDNPDYIELYLMSQCKHFIISNSTFSWWAQYLSNNERKVVIAPSLWNRSEKKSKQIYMPNWNLIDVE